MKDPLTRLTEKTASLGNYNRKYIHIISNNIDNLIMTLEQRGVRDRVHLWNYSSEIPGEMDTILQCASDDKEKLDLLGCYFALQFLHMNLQTVDIVKLELATSQERWRTGIKLMLESGRRFRFLTKCYMERLLGIFIGDREMPEFVLLGVGTRADQDDIDLGVIYEGPYESDALNRAIGFLSSEMLKKATRLHCHLSEHVGQRSFAATIEDYEEILEKGMYDFVIVTEMLGAAVIIGSDRLFEQFQERVTDRFYYNANSDQGRYHEGYLRGILGEIHSLLTRPKPSDTIFPKDEGLRPIKTLLSALKLTHGVRKTDTWEIIDELKEKNPNREQQYQDIKQALSFIEIFRHLYQILVAQDEDIGLYEPSIDSMVANIAEMIGFEKKGVVSAKDFMMVNYYEFLEKSHKAIDILAGDLRKHLKDISIFKSIFAGEIFDNAGYKGNLAVCFIRTSRFFKGISYWDDFLEELGDDSKEFYDEFIASFNELPERMMKVIGYGYVYGIRYDPTYSLRFLCLLGEKAKNSEAKSVFNYISKIFIEKLENMPSISYLMTHMVYAYPRQLNSFLSMIDWDSLTKIRNIVRLKPGPPDLIPIHNQLKALVDIHYQSSQFFKQHFRPILNKHPVYIKNLYNNEKLKDITAGFYSDLTTLPTLRERIEQIGDYYDLEFVRISLQAMADISCEVTDAEFTEFCDRYALSLYEFCLQEVHISLGYSMHTHDLFALYATGGHAREQGFDDDYDMIAILDSSDPEHIDYCNKIVGKMNSEILKRGILPHHRFADHFGSYIVQFDQLAEYLSGSGEELFIDKSQVLSSRMLVGSSKLENKLQNEIISPYIFSKGGEYIEEMKGEMKSRHNTNEERHKYDIKECRGGLRDIEMLLLIYKTKYEVRDPLSRKFLQRLTELEPDHKQEFKYIEEHLNFIKKLRDLYRLKIAAHNVLDRDYLMPVADSMNYGNDDAAAKALCNDFLTRTSEASRVINKLIDSVKL